jgi:hypothetical protein
MYKVIAYDENSRYKDDLIPDEMEKHIYSKMLKIVSAFFTPPPIPPRPPRPPRRN